MIKYSLRFTKDKKPVLNFLAVYNEIKRQFKVNPEEHIFTITINKLREPKTFNQLAYFNAEIVRKVLIGYREAGYDLPTNQKNALDWVKYQIKTLPEIDFTEDKTNVITGEVTTQVRSFATASKQEMSDIIDKCIRIYSEYFGITFESPEEYKRRKL